MTDNLESRLDRLGEAATQEAPGLPENSAFLLGVRRRGRARAMRNTLITFGGVALAAAALLVAALVNPPRAQTEGVPTPVDPQMIASVARPTLGELNRVTWSAENPGDIPLLTRAHGGTGEAGNEPVHAAAVHSKKAMAELGL